MRKILIYTDAFSGGGAEEVMNIFAKELRKKYQLIHVSKWLGPRKSKLPFWKISLERNSLRESIPKIIYILKHYKPDVVLTSTGHNNLLFLLLKVLFFRKIKVIIRESSVASSLNVYNSIKGRMLNKLVKILYPFSNKIITQSDDMTQNLIDDYNINKNKIIKLSNPVVFDYVGIPKRIDVRVVNLLTIGRLSVEKGYFRLFDIIKKLPRNYYLTIMGKGQLELKLIEKVKELGIEKQVNFLGYRSGEEKLTIILESDIYVQTSFVEGFPNSLLECAYNGIPCIAFDVKGGTKEIVNSINGKLIKDGDIDEMVFEIKNTTWSAFSMEEMRSDIDFRFGKEKIMSQLNNILKEVLID